MSLSHCIHQTLNSKASTRFHSGGGSAGMPRSEERFSRNAETDLVCRLLLEKKKKKKKKDKNNRNITLILYSFFFYNDTAPPELYTLSLHDALPISPLIGRQPT